MAYIYKITNKINGKIYIGKTSKSVEKRWKEHCNDFQKERCERRPLYFAMKKYGIENFSIEEIEQCDNPEERETYWIEYYGSFKDGYNATKGGDGKSYIDYDLVVSTYKQIENMSETAKKLNISIDSVSKILKEKNIIYKNSKEVIQKKYGKIVNMYSLNGEYIRSFPSLWEAAKYMIDNNLTGCKTSTIKQHISEVCRGKRKTASKFIWKFD